MREEREEREGEEGEEEEEEEKEESGREREEAKEENQVIFYTYLNTFGCPPEVSEVMKGCRENE